MRFILLWVVGGFLLLEPAAGWAQKKSKFPLSNVDRLRADLKSDKVEVRKAALYSIQHSLHRQLAADVIPLIGDPAVRKEAIYACQRLGWSARAARPRLLKALKDDNSEIRYEAAMALGTGTESGKGVLGALIAALEDKDVRVRIAAAESIGNFRDEGRPAFAALCKALKDLDQGVRTTAASAIGWVGRQDMPAASDALLELLAGDSIGDWSAAQHGLFWLGDIPVSVMPRLLKALEHPKPGIRSCGAHGLGSIGPKAKEAVPALIKALADEEPGVRSGAVWSLGMIGSDAAKAVPALIEAFKTNRQQAPVVVALGKIGPQAAKAVPDMMRWLAAGSSHDRVIFEALAGIGPPAKEAIPVLLRYLDQPKNRQMYRVQAAVALWNIDKHPAALRALIDVLKSPRTRDRGEAALALAEVGPDGEEAIPDLIAAVRDAKRIHYGVCVALGRFGKSAKNAVPALLDALDKSADPYSKKSVAVALWRIERHPRALSTLTALLKDHSDDESFRVRYHAATQLGELGKEAAAAGPALVPALRDEFSMVRRAAALSLGQLAASTPDIVSALQSALKDEIWTVRAEAAHSLGKLGAAAQAALPALRAVRADPLVESAVAQAIQRIQAKN